MLPIGKTQDVPSTSTKFNAETSPTGKPARRDSAGDPRVADHAHSVDAVSDTAPVSPSALHGARFSEGQATRPRNLTPDFKQADDEVARLYNYVPPEFRGDDDDVPLNVAEAASQSAPADVVQAKPQLDKQAQKLVKLQEVLQKGVKKMVDELVIPANADPRQEAAVVKDLMNYLTAPFNALRKEGQSDAVVVQQLKEMTEAALLKLDHSSRKLAIEGFSRFEACADDSNPVIASRHMAQTVKDIGLKALHRDTLDNTREMEKMERANAPKPTTIGGKLNKFGEALKQGGLTSWRGAKSIKREIVAEYGPAAKAEAAAAAERDHYRGLVDIAMKALIASTRPDVMKSDDGLHSLLGRVGSPSGQSSEIIDARRKAAVQDFVVAQHTDSLVALATRLLETVPYRTVSDANVNDLGHVLQEELRLRPGCQEIAEALGNRALSGSCTRQENIRWNIDRAAELMITLVTANAQEEAMVLKDLEPISYQPQRLNQKDKFEEAVKALTLQQLDAVGGKLQRPEASRLEDLLKAVTDRRQELRVSDAA